MYLQSLLLAKLRDEQLTLNVGLHPLLRIHNISLVEGYLLIVEEATELLHDIVVHLEILGYMLGDQVMLGEIKECVVLQQCVLKWVCLGSLDLDGGIYSDTAVSAAPAIGFLISLIRSVRVTFFVDIILLIVNRNPTQFCRHI